MNPPYLAKDPQALIDAAPVFVQDLIDSGEIETLATSLGEKYKVAIDHYTALANVISFIIIGAIPPEHAIDAFQDIVGLNEADAKALVAELESGIFKKVRDTTLGKTSKDDAVVTLAFEKGNKGDKKTEELRKEILDTTKRESGITKNQAKPDQTKPKGPPQAASGSRNQLLEQLQILGTIPNDEEVESRLKHIQEQIAELQTKESEKQTITTTSGEVVVTTKLVKAYDFGEDADKAVKARTKTASYSTAPTHYNVDPYREVSED